MVSYYFATVVISLAVTAVALGSHSDSCPQHRGLPDGYKRGTNKIKNRGLYRIDLRKALKGYEPGKIYKFRVHTSARGVKFNDATVIADPVNKENCGVGKWIINDNDKLYSPTDCPDIVTTEQKEPMGRAHFLWQAPACGCVHFRVRVHAKSEYFLEDSEVNNGPLARTTCPKPGSVKTEARARSTVRQLSRHERLYELCKVGNVDDVDKLMKASSFQDRRGTSHLEGFEFERLGIAVQQRQNEIRECCEENDVEDMVECFGDVRRQRIDKFCATGEPSIPFTKDRYKWMFQKRTECCYRIGESRYDCFNSSMQTNELQRDAVTGEQGLVLNMDDFDPVNDVEDFVGETHRKYQHIHSESRQVQMDSTRRHESHRKHTKPDRNVITSTPRPESIPSLDARPDETTLDDLKDESKDESADGDDGDDDDNDDDDDDEEDDEDDNEDDEDSDSKEDGKTLTKRKLSVEECCLNGIDAGVRVKNRRREECFNFADEYEKVIRNWNKRCDRNFVICCMRVIDGPTKRHRYAQTTNTLVLLKALGKTPLIVRLPNPQTSFCSHTDNNYKNLPSKKEIIYELGKVNSLNTSGFFPKENEVLSENTGHSALQFSESHHKKALQKFNPLMHTRRLRKKYKKFQAKLEYSKRGNRIIKTLNTG